MHVVACQFDIAWEDREQNHARVASMLAGETIPPGSLIVLPEMFASGFTMDVDAAEDVDGTTGRFLNDLARDHQSTVLAGIVNKHPDGRGLNQAVVIGADGVELTRYTKMHPFTPAGESEHYRAGEKVMAFTHTDFTVAPMICYDLRFPERFREAVRQGAEVLVVIANWPSARAEHWTALLAARAIENQAYVVGVNRVGRDPNGAYPGLSTVIDPKGHAMISANDQPTVLHADLDRQTLLDYRRSFPVLDDMRE
jgi:omega-amidase